MAVPIDVDKEKLAKAALAILWLGAHSDGRATRVWKQMDWDLTDLLFERGWISDPKTRAQSVVLTEEGERLSENFFQELFSKPK
jgi:hypothetical protein